MVGRPAHGLHRRRHRRLGARGAATPAFIHIAGRWELGTRWHPAIVVSTFHGDVWWYEVVSSPIGFQNDGFRSMRERKITVTNEMAKGGFVKPRFLKR